MTIAEQLIKEGMEKVELEMVADGETIKKIIKYTKLTPEQIKELSKEIKH